MYNALVLKVKNRKPDLDVRPISLCNVIYKLVTKLMTNKLKAVTREVISLNQSAFILSRLTSNNIIVSHECLSFFKKRKRGQVGFATLKLDMSKAYDRVEWYFLRPVMVRLGFCKE